MKATLVVAALTAVIATGAARQDVMESFHLSITAAEAHHRPGGIEKRNGCHRLYSQRRYYTYSQHRFKHRLYRTVGQKRYMRRMARCQHSEKKERWAWRKRALLRHRFEQRWQWRLLWQRLPLYARAWTERVSWCESRNQRYTTGSFESFFQWTRSTWWATGASRSPYAVTWHEQAVRAWRWHVAHPVGQWPTCGE